MKNQIANYGDDQVDVSARKAIEIMSQTIASLFYGKDFRNEIVQQAREEMIPQIKQEIATSQLETEKKILDSEKRVLEKAQTNVETYINNREMSRSDKKRLDKAKKRKVAKCIGGNYNSDNWTLFSFAFFGAIKREVCKKFKIQDYEDITSGNVDEVIAFIDGLELDMYAIVSWAKEKLDKKYISGEWDNSATGQKKKLAYERHFIH